MWRPIGIPFQGDGRHGYNRAFGKPPFQSVVFRLAFRQALPPAVIMDHDADVIRIVEGRCAAIERGIIEAGMKRSLRQLRRAVPSFWLAPCRTPDSRTKSLRASRQARRRLPFGSVDRARLYLQMSPPSWQSLSPL